VKIFPRAFNGSFHLFLGRLFLRAGSFLRSLAIMVMRPEDLIRFARETYQDPAVIAAWGNQEMVDSGLKIDEQELFDELYQKKGRLLLLGLGGGREALFFARQGYKVTGVDYIPELVKIADQHARRQGVALEGITADINNLALQPLHYDVVWFTRPLYSTFPTRKRRIKLLQHLAEAMQPSGCIACQFHFDPGAHPGKSKLRLRRLVAALTLGNFSYEPGDMLWGGIEFSHAFGSEQEVASEFAEAKLEIHKLHFSAYSPRGWAILRKQIYPAGHSRPGMG